MKALIAFVVLASFPTGGGAAEPRATTDYEIAAAEASLRGARTSVRRIAAHLNLGDLRALRTETDLALAEYRAAEDVASEAALGARRRGDLEGYSRATAYRGVALAKLGETREAFEALEEALRYQADSPQIWNHYAWAMSLLNLPAKAEAAARNAVALARQRLGPDGSAERLLDLAIYRFALAGALLASDPTSLEAAAFLRDTRELLGSPKFDRIRRGIVEDESFEIFSFVENDAAAWLSLYNRVHHRLGALHESRGEIAEARAAYRDALALRSDDPKALSALARLASAETDRNRWFAEAFAANPFAPSTILAYESHAASGPEPEAEGTGGRVQRAIWLLERGRHAEARSVVESLAVESSGNQAVVYLESSVLLTEGRADEALALVSAAPSPLRHAIARGAARVRAGEASRASLVAALENGVLDPSQELLGKIAEALQRDDPSARLRAVLDRAVFTSLATLDPALAREDGMTVFQSGAIGAVPFRFSVPTAFHGSVRSGGARITFRVSGATGEGLLIEPLSLEEP